MTLHSSLSSGLDPAFAPLLDSVIRVPDDALDDALDLAGQQVALALRTVETGTHFTGSMAWRPARPPRVVTTATLKGRSSAESWAMADELRRTRAADATAIAVVTDVFASTPTGRTDALQARIIVPGQEDLVLCVPYPTSESAPSTDPFPQAPMVSEGHGVWSDARADRFLSALKDRAEEGSFCDRVPDAFAFPGPRPIASEEDVARLATLGPLAAFLMVAGADGNLETAELNVFQSSIAEVTDPLLVEIANDGSLDATQAVGALAADPVLSHIAVVALGHRLSGPRGSAAQGILERVLLDVARVNRQEDGQLRETEEQALDQVSQLLNRGRDAEQIPTVPIPDGVFASAQVESDFEEAAPALLAGLLLVAGADGHFAPEEAKAFKKALAAADHPLIRSLANASACEGHLEQHRTMLRLNEDPSSVGEALAAAGRLFERHPQGDGAREAFLDVFRAVAQTQALPDGSLREEEASALRIIENGLEGTLLALWLPVGLALGALMATVLTIGHVTAGLLGGSTLATPIGAAAVLAVVALAAWTLSGFGRARTFMLNVLATGLATVGATLAIAVVGLFVPATASALWVGVVTAAVGSGVAVLGGLILR